MVERAWKDGVTLGAIIALMVFFMFCGAMIAQQANEINELKIRLKFTEAKLEAVDDKTDDLMDIMKRFFAGLQVIE